MAQNIYDRSDFFAGYSELDRSVHGLEGAGEWPSVRALIPSLTGSRVVDLGCGMGWFSRWAIEQGATSVSAFDLSERMIERAKSSPKDGIDYQVADIEQLELSEATFDFAYSSLAFHYVADFGRLVRQVHQSLQPGSTFVLTIEHPIFMAPTSPDWVADAGGKRSWPVNGYGVEGRRVTNWIAEGVVKYHRTFGSIVNALVDAGFAIRRVEDWRPTQAQLTAHPEWEEHLDRPMFLLLQLRR
jgi:SAM-dependent methyltransferase